MAGRKSRDKGYRQTEEEFQCAVIDYAHFNGWKVAHFRKAMRKDGSYVTPVQADGKGFPDLLMVRQGRIVVAELKSMGRKPTLEQRAWLEAFTDTEKEMTELITPVVQARSFLPSKIISLGLTIPSCSNL